MAYDFTVKPTDFGLMTPMQAQQGALTIQDLMARTQINQQQAQQGQMNMANQMFLSDLAKDPKNLQGGAWTPEALQKITARDPNLGHQITQAQTKDQFAAQQLALEQVKTKQENYKLQSESLHDAQTDAIEEAESQGGGDPKKTNEAYQKAWGEKQKQLRDSGLFGADTKFVDLDYATAKATQIKHNGKSGDLDSLGDARDRLEALKEESTHMPPNSPQLASMLLKIKDGEAAINKLTGSGSSEETPFMKEAAALYGKDSKQYKDAVSKHLARQDAPSATTINMQGGSNTDRLTDKGMSLYEELLGAGKPVPKTTRGQIDYKVLNDMAEKEKKPGDVVTGIVDAKINQGIIKEYTVAGKPRQSIISINAVADHAETYLGLMKALKTGNLQLINQYKNRWVKEVGGTAPGNAEEAISIFAPEVVKAVLPGGATADERRHQEDQWKTDLSGDQAESKINTAIRPLLRGQYNALKQGYDSTGRDINKLFTPQARKFMGVEDNTPAAGNAAPAPKQISTDAEYNALPSGATFIGPDGKTRKKP